MSSSSSAPLKKKEDEEKVKKEKEEKEKKEKEDKEKEDKEKEKEKEKTTITVMERLSVLPNTTTPINNEIKMYGCFRSQEAVPDCVLKGVWVLDYSERRIHVPFALQKFELVEGVNFLEVTMPPLKLTERFSRDYILNVGAIILSITKGERLLLWTRLATDIKVKGGALHKFVYSPAPPMDAPSAS